MLVRVRLSGGRSVGLIGCSAGDWLGDGEPRPASDGSPQHRSLPVQDEGCRLHGLGRSTWHLSPYLPPTPSPSTGSLQYSPQYNWHHVWMDMSLYVLMDLSLQVWIDMSLQVLMDLSLQVWIDMSLQVLMDLSLQVWIDMSLQVLMDLSLQVWIDMSLQVWMDLSLQVWIDMSLQVLMDLSLQVLMDLSLQVLMDLSLQVWMDLSLQVLMDLSFQVWMDLSLICVDGSVHAGVDGSAPPGFDGFVPPGFYGSVTPGVDGSVPPGVDVDHWCETKQLFLHYSTGSRMNRVKNHVAVTTTKNMFFYGYKRH